MSEETPALEAQRTAEAEAQYALANKLRYEADKLRIEAEREQSMARVTAIALEREELAHAYEKSTDYACRVYRLSGGITANSTQSCISIMTAWSRMYPGQPMELVLNSPGGSVTDGLALYDELQRLRAAGHHLTTRTVGMAASMGSVLLQAGDRRVMAPEAFLLVHEIAAGAIGKIGEIEDEMNLLKRMSERILSIYAARSRMTAKAIAAKWKRTDWWLNATEALELGLVDEIG